MVCGVFANIFFSVCDFFYISEVREWLRYIIKMIGMTMFDSQDCGCGGWGEWNGNLHLKRSKFHETTKKSAVSPNGEKKTQQEVVGIYIYDSRFISYPCVWPCRDLTETASFAHRLSLRPCNCCFVLLASCVSWQTRSCYLPDVISWIGMIVWRKKTKQARWLNGWRRPALSRASLVLPFLVALAQVREGTGKATATCCLGGLGVPEFIFGVPEFLSSSHHSDPGVATRKSWRSCQSDMAGQSLGMVWSCNLNCWILK